jgi:DNA-binding NarL/FixJ family response regulator
VILDIIRYESQYVMKIEPSQSIDQPAHYERFEENGMAKIRVLVVDDYTLVREGIRECLEQTEDIAVIGEAVNGEKALEFVEEFEPDVTLMDVRMPVMDGIAATRAIRSTSPNSRIVILSAYNETVNIRKLLELGVNAFLLKTCEINDLQEAIRAVVRGELFIQPGLVFARN